SRPKAATAKVAATIQGFAHNEPPSTCRRDAGSMLRMLTPNAMTRLKLMLGFSGDFFEMV
ncbi:MAG: hypothetical protein ACXU85_06440, partial [Xanthobacteraceae bacterium]